MKKILDLMEQELKQEASDRSEEELRSMHMEETDKAGEGE